MEDSVLVMIVTYLGNKHTVLRQLLKKGWTHSCGSTVSLGIVLSLVTFQACALLLRRKYIYFAHRISS